MHASTPWAQLWKPEKFDHQNQWGYPHNCLFQLPRPSAAEAQKDHEVKQEARYCKRHRLYPPPPTGWDHVHRLRWPQKRRRWPEIHPLAWQTTGLWDGRQPLVSDDLISSTHKKGHTALYRTSYILLPQSYATSWQKTHRPYGYI